MSSSGPDQHPEIPEGTPSSVSAPEDVTALPAPDRPVLRLVGDGIAALLELQRRHDKDRSESPCPKKGSPAASLADEFVGSSKKREKSLKKEKKEKRNERNESRSPKSSPKSPKISPKSSPKTESESKRAVKSPVSSGKLKKSPKESPKSSPKLSSKESDSPKQSPKRSVKGTSPKATSQTHSSGKKKTGNKKSSGKRSENGGGNGNGEGSNDNHNASHLDDELMYATVIGDATVAGDSTVAADGATVHATVVVNDLRVPTPPSMERITLASPACQTHGAASSPAASDPNSASARCRLIAETTAYALQKQHGNANSPSIGVAAGGVNTSSPLKISQSPLPNNVSPLPPGNSVGHGSHDSNHRFSPPPRHLSPQSMLHKSPLRSPTKSPTKSPGGKSPTYQMLLQQTPKQNKSSQQSLSQQNSSPQAQRFLQRSPQANVLNVEQARLSLSPPKGRANSANTPTANQTVAQPASHSPHHMLPPKVTTNIADQLVTSPLAKANSISPNRAKNATHSTATNRASSGSRQRCQFVQAGSLLSTPVIGGPNGGPPVPPTAVAVRATGNGAGSPPTAANVEVVSQNNAAPTTATTNAGGSTPTNPTATSTLFQPNTNRLSLPVNGNILNAGAFRNGPAMHSVLGVDKDSLRNIDVLCKYREMSEKRRRETDLNAQRNGRLS